MNKHLLALLLVCSAALIACGGATDSPNDARLPLFPPAAEIEEVGLSSAQRSLTATPSQLETTSTISSATPSTQFEKTSGSSSTITPTQQSVDDKQAEALVGEWEADLAPISRLEYCVRQKLKLARPLLPEDLELQANQPAILSCIEPEVSSE